MTLGQLRALMGNLTLYYAQRGYLARALIPQQDIRDGIVTVRIIESRRGNISIEKKGERVDAARIERIIAGELPQGEPLNISALGRTVEVLSEHPGVDVKASLAGGETEGLTNLRITATDEPLVTTFISANNQGSRSSGVIQLSGGVTLNNPTGLFDAASVLVNASDGNTFGRLDYSLAVGDSGLRMGVNVSHLSYRLTQDAFAALSPRGSAATEGLTASYPVTRRTDRQLTVAASLDRKRLLDQNNLGETGNRHVRAGSVDVSGYVVDELFGGGATLFSASLGFGEAQQRNAAALAADRLTRNTDGSFHKMGWSLGRQQGLTNGLALNLSLRGQFAAGNLDSSERFSLGGVSGIRAYPGAEANGDEGWVFSANLSRRLSDALTASVFLDAGGIKLNHTTWNGWDAANPALPNRYELAGAGIGLDWRVTNQVRINASAALPIGNNPGKDVSGNNSDGARNRGRAWVSMVGQF